jgi:hypothetical protein
MTPLAAMARAGRNQRKETGLNGGECRSVVHAEKECQDTEWCHDWRGAARLGALLRLGETLRFIDVVLVLKDSRPTGNRLPPYPR